MPDGRKSIGINPEVDDPVDVDISEPLDLDKFFNELEDEDTVSVMNLRSMKIYYVGKNTGRTYVFDGAGSIVNDVDKIDAEEMITLPVTPSCCGSFPTPYFQIVGR